MTTYYKLTPPTTLTQGDLATLLPNTCSPEVLSTTDLKAKGVYTVADNPGYTIQSVTYNAGTDSLDVTWQAIPTPTPIPQWDALRNELLTGTLYPIFSRITEAALGSNPISTARGDITDAILTVRDEDALASGIQLLLGVGYTFTAEEKILWNTKVAELNFSEEVNLP
jgi:hypothetical protein